MILTILPTRNRPENIRRFHADMQKIVEGSHAG
jgi:hypothetical protein